jgi:hypothetical protein
VRGAVAPAIANFRIVHVPVQHEPGTGSHVCKRVEKFCTVDDGTIIR